MGWNWRLKIENCTGCGICRDVCSSNAIKMPRSMAYPEPIKGKCSGCMDCITQCPFEAIDVSETTENVRSN